MAKPLAKMLVLLMILRLASCSDAAEKVMIKKGGHLNMRTYFVGRFAIDVPADFKLIVRRQKIRYADVEDFKWQNQENHGLERADVWAKKVAEIKQLHKPVDKDQVVIEEKELKGLGLWARAIVYYGDYLVTDMVYWTVLVDFGEIGVWLTLDGEDDNLTVSNFNNILSHYKPGFGKSSSVTYFTNVGRVELPYLEQERAYARFSGPGDVVLRMEIRETCKPEKVGLIDRLIASKIVNYAPGVDIEKIKARARTVAGLDGQEIIVRLKDGDGEELLFAWNFPGKKDSGEYPEIKLGIETSDGELGRNQVVWDKVLTSFRPVWK